MNLQSVIVVRQVRHEYTQFTPVTQYRAGRGVASVSLDRSKPRRFGSYTSSLQSV